MLSPADVALSKGQAPKIDPKRVVRSALNGAPIGVWMGAVVQAPKK